MSNIYLISPPKIELEDFAENLNDALSTGKVGAFQLRLKDITLDDIEKAVKILLPICHHNQTPFFINDHYELARKHDIDGIHIGQDDGNISAIIKEFSGKKIIGVSCQNSKHLAMIAGEKGADYVSFGAFFTTKTKDNTKKADIEILNWWSKYTKIPCAAIGGINQKNISQIAKTKVDFICMISAIWNHPKGAKEAILEFNQLIENN